MRILRLSPLLLLGMSACNTHVIVEQPKPLEININFTGHLDLVIQDARQNLEQITGEKPTNHVRPEDIGLPAAPRSSGQLNETESLLAALAASVNDDHSFDDAFGIHTKDDSWPFTAGGEISWQIRSTRQSATVFIAEGNGMLQSMKARSPEILALWQAGLIGESHTGLVVPKGQLTETQQQSIAAENADRQALYAGEAKTKKLTQDEVVIGYYLSRLNYAKPGAWYEKMNAGTKQWEWKQWGQ